jgi:hydrogenase expression/formation protein HypE
MKQACEAANQLDMSIITGHTGTYPGVSTPIATCTSYGIIKRNKLITPAGAHDSDLILMTKPLGLETLINIALTNTSLAQRLFGSNQARYLTSQISMQSCVEEALLLASKGVSAMHDATEGGLVAALNEVAAASNLGFLIDFDKILISPQLQSLVKHYHLTTSQTLSISSTGSIIAAFPPQNTRKILNALSTLGVKASIIGHFTKSKARRLKHMGRKDLFPQETDDPYNRILST